jgi:hypothetical protein
MLYEKIGGCPASNAGLERNGVRLKSQYCRPLSNTAHRTLFAGTKAISCETQAGG